MSQSTLDAFARETAAGEDAPFVTTDGRVQHPLVRSGTLEARDYQLRLAARAARESLLVVLPTGLGKTAIAVLAAAERLRHDLEGKVVVVAPTRPLVHQHARAFRDQLAVRPELVVALTGHVAPRERAEVFARSRVIVSTPHGLANDVEAGRIALDRVVLLVVDEAHRTVGNYPYVPLARAYRAQRAVTASRILGLTASPGSRRERIANVLEALGGPRVEAREREDDDVKPVVKDTLVSFRHVALPEATRVARDELEKLLSERVQKLKAFIPRRTLPERIGKGALLETGEVIRKRLAVAKGPSKGFCFAAMQNHAVAVQALHALELLETQGLAPFRSYVERVAAKDKPSRAQTAFLGDARVERCMQVARSAVVSHPKENAMMHALSAQFEEKPESLVLVFAQYRDTVRVLLERIRRAGFPVTRFVGQADKGAGDEGLSQDEQAEVLRRFERGDVRVLVATSVAEEGLHVPNVDLVVFYEPVPSEIRTIQRRGRTGRSHVGRVVVLVTEDSRDEVFLKVEAEREADMKRIVGEMRKASG